MAIIIKSHKDTLLIDSILVLITIVVMYFREKKICMNVLYEIVKQVL